MTKIRFDHAAGLAAAALFAFAPAQAASTTNSNSATRPAPRLRSAPTTAMRAASACACSRAARASRVRSARPRRSGKRPAACPTASASRVDQGLFDTLHLRKGGRWSPAVAVAPPPPSGVPDPGYIVRRTLHRLIVRNDVIGRVGAQPITDRRRRRIAIDRPVPRTAVEVVPHLSRAKHHRLEARPAFPLDPAGQRRAAVVLTENL